MGNLCFFLPIKSASIIAVERSFGGGLEKAEECDPPEIYKVNSPADECQLAAYRINALIREKGYRYRDFAVTSRDWPSYEGTLENIFEKYDIPTISMKKEDILQKPIMSLVTSALDTVEENWSYESVFSYLKTNLTGISFEDRDILENYVIKWNIRGRSMWLRDESWTFNPEGYEAEITPENKALLERINEIKSKVTEPFLTSVTAFSGDTMSTSSVRTS